MNSTEKILLIMLIAAMTPRLSFDGIIDAFFHMIWILLLVLLFVMAGDEEK